MVITSESPVCDVSLSILYNVVLLGALCDEHAPGKSVAHAFAFAIFLKPPAV